MNDSLVEILKELIGDVQQLLRAEFALVQSEIKTKLTRALSSSTLLLVGIVLALMGLPILLLGIAAVIAIWLPAWASLLIVAAAVMVAGGLAISIGLQRIAKLDAVPKRTIANLQRDAQVIKEHV